ncbi:autotransporter-associated beta strand repeat-containing protein [Luteolibacter ambystomatis]|uniref:Autotransporter-associated beta strand repeat-containing protein n=1 Tax=Luteolibacter ambystomatis TaxID=2824561 RepID=A0A975G6N6_9BACT|nr:autotransporter-associated beta strand repeat-containing protein [Luteolibacter ambystomatis]QUE50314.1 autotransporter-associated beta strand repeat-containing protein [Luteolibacter ambystomatis]
MKPSLLLLAFLGSFSTASAATINWTDGGDASGAWNNLLFNSQAYSAVDDLVIGGTAAKTVTMGAGVTAPATLLISNTGNTTLNSTSGPAGGALTKTGAGRLILTGGANNFSSVSISGGPASQTGGAVELSTLTGGVYNGLGSGAITLGNTSAMTAFFFGASGTLSNNIALTTSNAATWLTGTAGGRVTTLSGVISGGNASADLRLDNNTAAGVGRFVFTNAANTFTINRFFMNRGGLEFTSDGALGNAANDLFLDVTSSNAGTGLLFGADNITLNSGRSVTVNSTTVVDTQTFNGSRIDGTLTLTGQMVKRGAGTLIVNGAGSGSGGIQVVVGGIQIGAGGTTGSIGTGNVSLASGTSLSFNRTDTGLTVGGVISGAGSVTQSGTGTTSLTGTNTYSGGTTIASGAVSISNGSGLGTGAVTVTKLTGGDLLTVTNNAAITLANDIALSAPTSAQTFNLIKNSSSASGGTQLSLTGVISGGSANHTLFLNTNTSGDNTTTFRFAGNNTFRSSIQLNRGAIVVAHANGLGNTANILKLDGNNNTTLGDLRFEIGMTLANSAQLIAGQTNVSTGTNAVEMSGVMSGSGALNKLGTGALTLSNTNTYSGATIVSAGTLFVNGSLGNGAVTVASGATLGGTGSVGGSVTVNGSFAPGAGNIESLNVGGSLALNNSADFEIDATSHTNDLAVVAANLAFGGVLNVTNLSGTLALNDSFDLFNFSAGTGTFSAVNLPTLDGGLSWDTSALYTTGAITVVPEPGTAFVGGLGLLLILRRRR